MPVYNYFTALLGIVTAAIIVYLVRRDSLAANYVLWWLGIAAGLIIVGIFPQSINYFGRLLGVGYPPIILIILSWCLILVKLLFMDIDRCRQERKIRVLTQRLAVYGQNQEERGLKTEDRRQKTDDR